MKTNKFIFTITIFAILFAACEDQIILEPKSSITNISFWKTEDDVTSALNGMYDRFRRAFDNTTVVWGDWRTGYYDYGMTQTAAPWDHFWENDLSSSDPFTNWAALYELINNANLILAKAPDIEFTREEEKNNILGQAYFIRAYTYFQIARNWGDAPIVTKGFESTDQNLNPSRSSQTEIYSLVKEDIEQAINLLSPSSSKNYAGIEAAQMLKTEVYLWTAKLHGGGNADLQEANAAIQEVLDAGYNLESDFATVFRNENNSEVIFSVFYSQDELGDGAAGSHPMQWTVPPVQFVPEELIGTIPSAPHPQPLGFNDFFLNEILNPASIDSRSQVTWRRVVGPETGREVFWINKYIGDEIAGSNLSTSDLIIYRLADAVLLNAEIENALGNTQQAQDALNEIALRAYGIEDYYSGLSGEDLDEAILDERVWELVFEGKVWYDFRRFGKAFERISSLTGREGDNEGNILFLPVDQDVLNRNQNIVQTKGYN